MSQVSRAIKRVLQILYHFFLFEMPAYTFYKYWLILIKPLLKLIFGTKKHPRRSANLSPFYEKMKVPGPRFELGIVWQKRCHDKDYMS